MMRDADLARRLDDRHRFTVSSQSNSNTVPGYRVGQIQMQRQVYIY